MSNNSIDPIMNENHTFELYDLKITVGLKPGSQMVCSHQEGDYFELQGERLLFPSGQSFPLYPLAALLPILPAKQRMTDPNDWMTTDADIACPDPYCGGLFHIARTGKRVFRHEDVTAVPVSGAV